MERFTWDRVKKEVMNPKLWRKVIAGEKAMVAQVFIAKGGVVPTHQHESEQISYIVEGALKFELEGQDVAVRAGEVLVFPPTFRIAPLRWKTQWTSISSALSESIG